VVAAIQEKEEQGDQELRYCEGRIGGGRHAGEEGAGDPGTQVLYR
jgi:hypothetical protein